jgi:hypothetical protein
MFFLTLTRPKQIKPFEKEQPEKILVGKIYFFTLFVCCSPQKRKQTIFFQQQSSKTFSQQPNSYTPTTHANLCQDSHGQDYHNFLRIKRFYRKRQAKDSGQGRFV